ncbi:MAG: hypothetical protein PHU80_09950, partial [Kiritimatiellae bacterium]|nr:hypothetical protein [Kiritimatiellia bacterium]
DERLEAEPKAAEAERREQERLAAERKAAEERNEKERLVEAERRAAEIAEAKRKDDERLAAERKEKERLAEAERKERDRKAAEVAEAERKERERKAAEVAEAKRKEEERLAAERKAEAERSAIALLVDLARDRAVLNNYCAFMSKNREEEMRERVEKVGETAQRLASWADGKKDNDGTPVVDGAGAIEQFMGALAYILDKDSLIAVINDLESQLQNLNFTGRSSSDQYKKTEGLKNAFERIRDEASKMDNLKTNEDRLRLIALVKWIGKDLKNF